VFGCWGFFLLHGNNCFLTKEHSGGKTVTNFKMVKNIISHKHRICCQNNPKSFSQKARCSNKLKCSSKLAPDLIIFPYVNNPYEYEDGFVESALHLLLY